MILLDTNIISEIMRPSRSLAAVRWLDAQPARSLYISTLVLAELRFGLELVSSGAKRTALEEACQRIADELFHDRILSFDRAASDHFGKLRAERRRVGKPITTMDALIAAVALSNSMTLATRNTADFAGIGLSLVNPFEAAVP
ncbi:MAG TPA: type II toxin-antitoxin system VapC family toxin [Roseiarcus sp.]|nr:type II toxin-antitoxin system VapC family toxin [Roseiarcus sp.]